MKTTRIVTDKIEGMDALPDGGFQIYPWTKFSASFTMTEEAAADFERETGCTIQQHVDGFNDLSQAIVKGDLS